KSYRGKRPAFTLLELLIAVSVSSFIILGMTQAFRNTQKILSKSRVILMMNKATCLLFNQMERDFNTAFIPIVTKPAFAKASAGQGKEVAKEETKKKKTKDSKKDVKYFVTKFYEDELIKVDGKKHELFKSISLVNTNPLQVWGQKKVRLVRVGYELVKDKEKSNKERILYNLYRKETAELANEDFKEPEEVKKTTIRQHLIATDITHLSIEYSMPKELGKGKKKPDPDEKTEIKSFDWKKQKKKKEAVPRQVSIRITFWNETLKDKATFACMVPIFSYPTPEEKKPPEKKQPRKTDKDKTKPQEPPKPRR
ncbi:hypothetical protein KAT92_02275, partial [Candidatus Babeliales bacterium]|nr:hypothetical protein [Candidatus Babeliales bacterium]